MMMQPNPAMEGAPPSPDMQEQGPPAAGPEQGQGAEPPNPVIAALKTIAAFIAAQQEKNSPQASEMMSAFKALLQSFGAGQGAGPEEKPVAAGEEQVEPETEQGQMPMDTRRGAVPLQ